MSKDVIMLGMKDEIVSLDLEYMEEESIECIMEWVHEIVYKELLSRRVSELIVWSVRAMNVFRINELNSVGDLINIPKEKVLILDRCGYKTRKEVYDGCKEYGLTLLNWEPGLDYKREMNHYTFIDEEKEKIMERVFNERDEQGGM